MITHIGQPQSATMNLNLDGSKKTKQEQKKKSKKTVATNKDRVEIGKRQEISHLYSKTGQ